MDIRGNERDGSLWPTFLRDAVRVTILLFKLLKVSNFSTFCNIFDKLIN